MIISEAVRASTIRGTSLASFQSLARNTHPLSERAHRRVVLIVGAPETVGKLEENRGNESAVMKRKRADPLFKDEFRDEVKDIQKQRTDKQNEIQVAVSFNKDEIAKEVQKAGFGRVATRSRN